MPDQPEEFENPSQDLQSGADAAQSAASNAPRAVQYTGKAVQFTGRGLELAGKGLRALAPIPVVGWVAGGIGVGLMGAGKGMQAAGKGMEKGGQAAGKIKSALGPGGQLGPLKGLASPGGLAKFVPGPVGLAMRIKDLLSKLPVIGGLVNKLGDLNKKVLMGIGAGIGYLLLMLMKLLAKLIAMAGYAAAGAAIGFMIGGPLGAAIGAAIGAFLGPQIAAAVSNAVSGALGIFKGGATATANLPSSVASVTGSAASSAAGGIASAVSGAFSAVTGTIGGIISGAGSVIGGIGGALGGILNAAAGAVTSSVGTVAVATVGAIGTVGAFQMAIGVPSTHFATDADNPSAASAQNTFFKVTKSANQTALTNAPPNKEVTFTITLTTTRALSAVSITDSTSVDGEIDFQVNNDINSQAISQLLDCPKIIPAGGSCTRSFTIAVDSRFDNSTITNTVSVSAIPEGQGLMSSTASFVVSVGTPPANCPKGWPTTGYITQGPEGHFNDSSGQPSGHGDYGYEALDIGAVSGTTVFATFDGIVERLPQGRGGPADLRVRIKPASCSGLNTVNFWHLSSIFVADGESIKKGAVVGTSGAYFGAPHIHYQFNETNQRWFKIENPYVPVTVPRDCVAVAQCGNVYATAP